MNDARGQSDPQDCNQLRENLLGTRSLIIAANRGPVSIKYAEDGQIQFQRTGGGLATALIGLVQHIEATWIATAASDEDAQWKRGQAQLSEGGDTIQVQFLVPDPDVYNAYYNIISNPLLWFLQHSMWDFVREPNIDYAVWKAWNNGYVQMNQLFADAIARQIQSSGKPTLVMLQDYHLYLTPHFLKSKIRKRRNYSLLHFVHIPWPGPEDWGFLPKPIRESILEGLCAVDLLGFQTRADGLNFIRTVESLLPGARVNYRQGRVWYHNHATHVRDFPISIDIEALRKLAASEEVAQYRDQLSEYATGEKLIVRVDRSEPSKNIVRGFQAYGELLATHPEHRNKVHFLALLVPSRMAVEEYQNYLDEIMAAAGRINATYGTSEWEPVRVLVGENYPRAVAALQMYSVLLVNPIADGMNLVAKEGPVVNQCDGVMVLSERAGAAQQLSSGALVISPIDIFATTEALHQALSMPEAERRDRANRLRHLVEMEDIQTWLCWQLQTMNRLGL